NPILAKIYSVLIDLPEYLCVETKWVSHQYAMDNNVTVMRVAMVNGGHTEVTQNKSPEDDFPKRERGVQTDAKKTYNVAVQCCRDEEEWDWNDFNNREEEKDPKDSASEEAAFLTFVSDSTSMFPNGMLECQVCGEVASSLIEQQGHMKVHYGPEVLCCHCGQRIPHEKLVKRHNLSCPGLRPKKSSMFFKCPHPLCSVKCHSEMQLFRHLEKHRRRSSYRCLQCKQSFKTASTLLIHRKAAIGCSKAKCVTLFQKHKLSKEERDLRCCSVCLKRFSSERMCNVHRRKCILSYHKDLGLELLNEL
ncbi:zinc finger protein 354A, partial [Drosophila serrata]|uniref:zinc finger protein 354A n=1 Tax=Drosophila serrata TaxID=7274 RepID=UPI000A1CF65C